jgi:replicative DNA helicase
VTEDQWDDGREYTKTRPKPKPKSKPAEWQEPDRIGGSPFGKPEEFPVDVLPIPFADMVVSVAGNKQVPMTLPALMGMAAVSAIAAPRLAIECEPGWVEPLNTYSAVAMAYGAGKSPATKDVIREVRRLHRLVRANHADEIEHRRKDLGESVAILKERKTAKDASDEDKAQAASEIRELSAKLKELDEQIPPRILMPADITPESLARDMSTNGEHGAIIDSEGTFFAILSGRYSGGVPNLDAVLKAYDGDYVEVSRITRSQNDMTRAVLTLGLAVQPQVLADAAASRAMVELGFLARFYLAVPENVVGYRARRGTAYEPEVLDAWDAVVRRVAAFPVADPQLPDNQFPRLRLSSAAREALFDYRAWIEPRLRPDGELGDLPGWGSKHPTRAIRTAGLLHLIQGLGPDVPVGVETMNTAIAIGKWAIPHAIAVFGMDAETPQAEDENALALLQWIHGRRMESVKIREIARSCRQAWVKKGATTAVIAAVDRLAEAGWLRPVETTDKAGRATTIFECHPKLRAEAPLW